VWQTPRWQRYVELAAQLSRMVDLAAGHGEADILAPAPEFGRRHLEYVRAAGAIRCAKVWSIGFQTRTQLRSIRQIRAKP
jgi:hypothetical protein